MMTTERQTTLQAYLVIYGFLGLCRKYVEQILIGYANKNDELSDNCMKALEKKLVENLNRAFDMLPETDAVLEECEAEMVEMLNDVFVPGEQLYRYVEHTFNGKRIPLTSVN